MFRTADTLFTLARLVGMPSVTKVDESIFNRLVDARRQLGIFQHHDAITGTSVRHVMKDYLKRSQ